MASRLDLAMGAGCKRGKQRQDQERGDQDRKPKEMTKREGPRKLVVEMARSLGMRSYRKGSPELENFRIGVG